MIFIHGELAGMDRREAATDFDYRCLDSAQPKPVDNARNIKEAVPVRFLRHTTFEELHMDVAVRSMSRFPVTTRTHGVAGLFKTLPAFVE